jgi:hypothetical protein
MMIPARDQGIEIQSLVQTCRYMRMHLLRHGQLVLERGRPHLLQPLRLEHGLLDELLQDGVFDCALLPSAGY